ncbi:MAG TPA: hypothetical protein VNJ03_00115 [Vicinamibacterales bacterium]|nr:hypothetical protein [Vicinamibacterales bacterium]
MTRHLPGYGWIGMLTMLVSEAGMLAGVPPFAVWHTPIAWTGYVLFIDALVWKRRGSSWIRNAPAELFFLACASVPIWVIFEIYNKYFIRNWYYVGLPDVLLVRYVGYVWAFATILPAIFETADLVSSVRDRRAPHYRSDEPPPQPLTPAMWIVMAIGAMMLVVPIAYPSTYLAAPVWLGFIFLLDPLNARARDESILSDWRAGHTGRLINLLIAGLLCGVIWECWNYWATAKWIYNVPIFPTIKLFEMPVAGFLGFPPFAVECFVMFVAVRRWVWTGGRRPIAV